MISCGIRLRSRQAAVLSLLFASAAAAIGIAGCGAANNTYSPLVKGGATPSFSLAITPGQVSVVSGNSASYTVTITDSGGFNSPVSLSASNLPNGASATFGEPTSTATGETVPLTITTTTNAQEAVALAKHAVVAGTAGTKAAASRIVGTGNTTFTITGTGGGITQTATAVISISGAPDFTIAVTPASVTVPANQGTTSNFTVTITALGGFDVSTLTLANPTPSLANSRYSFGTPTVTSTGETVPLSVQTTTDNETPAGTYTLTVTGTGSNVTHSASFTVNVIDFTISATPSAQNLTDGHSGTYTVTLTSLGGTQSPATLSVSGVPSDGTTVTFSPTTVTPTTAGATTAMTVHLSSSAEGTVTLAITATEGSVSHTYDVNYSAFSSIN